MCVQTYTRCMWWSQIFEIAVGNINDYNSLSSHEFFLPRKWESCRLLPDFAHLQPSSIPTSSLQFLVVNVLLFTPHIRYVDTFSGRNVIIIMLSFVSSCLLRSESSPMQSSLQCLEDFAGWVSFAVFFLSPYFFPRWHMGWNGIWEKKEERIHVRVLETLFSSLNLLGDRERIKYYRDVPSWKEEGTQQLRQQQPESNWARGGYCSSCPLLSLSLSITRVVPSC